MNSAQKNAVANTVLDALQNIGTSYYSSTTYIYRRISHSLPSWCNQAHLRQILNILRQKGTISRLGGESAGAGKHKWKIEVMTWDRMSPLGVQKGRTALSHEPEDED